MDLRTLKTFQTIVKCGSFQGAADQLQYVQSSITSHIQKLEADLGVKLLERSKKVRLTEAGRLLYDQATLLLNDFEVLQNTMNEWIQGEAGVIRLGVMEPTASYRLPRILSDFRKQHPKVQIKIQIGGTYMLSQMLEEDQIELAICTTPDTGEGMSFEPLFTEELVLLVPRESPLAGKAAVCLKDLQGQNLLLTTALCPYRKKLESKLLEFGVTPKYGSEISMMSSLPYYVRAGFGVAVVPRIAVSPPPDETVAKPVVDLHSGLVTGILRKTSSTPLGSAASKLVQVVREGLKKEADQDPVLYG